MMNRAEFDSFLKLYGIPTSDEKYNAYKAKQTGALIDKQFKELASQVKQNVKKPTYPNMIIGPDEATGNEERMQNYRKQLAEYNKQQEIQKALIKNIQQGIQNKIKYYDQQEKLARTTTVPVNPAKKSDLNKLPKTSGLTPEQQKTADLTGSVMSKGISGPTKPIAKHETKPAKPVVKKPNKIPNTHQHINHNIMSFQEYKNLMLQQRMEVGQAQYKDYLRRFHLSNPTEYLQGQLEIEAKKRASESLAKGKSIEQHQKEHSKNVLNHMVNKNEPVPGSVKNDKYPPQIVIHNFDKPTPGHNEHHVSADSIHKEAGKQAGTMVGTPVSKTTSDIMANAVTSGAQAGSAMSGGVMAGASAVAEAITAGGEAGPKFPQP